ncbi:transcription co-repressor GAL80 [Paramyrothecium foliicola]|nr:transcription co-repressor GAL80 [Paramyrothecium foliicola]
MAPIRVALIGLSSSATTAWASSAHLPYLLSARGKSRYEIVALCNSSVESAQSAVKAYGLSAETRTYGDPEALANDPDIDLVVDSTRVDVHYPTILPSVKAGKNVYVEWPLADNVAHAQELTDLANKSGSRTIVGVQGRLSPPVAKLRELLQQGRIGKVLSSQFRGFGGTNDRERLPSGLKYFLDPAIGGNIFTIGYGHPFDQVQHVLGDFERLDGRLHLQRPDGRVFDSKTKEVIETVASGVPDLFITTGSLAASDVAQKGAPVLMYFRRGAPFPGEPALIWSINGEKGEIRLTAQAGTALHASAYSGPVIIEVHDFESDKVEQVEWKWADWQEELPVVGRSVAAVYDAYADGRTDGLASFEDALRRHQQLGGLFSEWQKSKQ